MASLSLVAFEQLRAVRVDFITRSRYWLSHLFGHGPAAAFKVAVVATCAIGT